jgi:hypothetical protein
MAATAFTLYHSTKEYLGNSNTIDLDAASNFRMHIVTSLASPNASTLTISTLGSLSGELASGNGYTQSGLAMTTTWTSVAAGTWRFDSNTVIVSASGGALNNITHAVVVAQNGASGKDGANKLVCVSKLSTASIDLSDGSTLTVDINASGVFEMS